MKRQKENDFIKMYGYALQTVPAMAFITVNSIYWWYPIEGIISFQRFNVLHNFASFFNKKKKKSCLRWIEITRPEQLLCMYVYADAIEWSKRFPFFALFGFWRWHKVSAESVDAHQMFSTSQHTHTHTHMYRTLQSQHSMPIEFFEFPNDYQQFERNL